MIPANIPGTYALKPMFESVAGEGDIRSGVIAFRDFLLLFCDRLISDGHLFAKPPKKPKSMDDYPFLHNVTNLMVDIGYYSKLAKSGDSLLITELPSCTASIDEKGKKSSPKISFTGLVECLRFLALCGFAFTGIDLEAKTLSASEVKLSEVFYPNNPILLTGLKAMSIADMELRPGRRYWNDNNLLRCDYRLMKAEDTDVLDVLKDTINTLPEDLQKFALKLHQRNMDMGMTCAMITRGEIHFAYSYIKKNRQDLSSQDIYTQRVWGISLSMTYGNCLVIRAKNTDKYADVIKSFPLSLQEIIAKGYGCDRKLRNERCQHGCQGIRIPLDDSILDISKDIETWLDREIFSRRARNCGSIVFSTV